MQNPNDSLYEARLGKLLDKEGDDAKEESEGDDNTDGDEPPEEPPPKAKAKAKAKAKQKSLAKKTTSADRLLQTLRDLDDIDGEET